MAVPGRKSLTISAVKSPSSPQQGNLTGPRRVVHDNVVGIYNSIQKWNQFYTNGIQIMQDMQQKEDPGVFQASCEKIGVLLDSLNQQVTVLQECANKLSSLARLHNSDIPVFISWSHQAFGNTLLR